MKKLLAFLTGFLINLFHLLSGRIVVILVLAYISGIIAVRFFIEGMSGAFWLTGILLLLLVAGLYLKSLDLYRAILILVVAAAGGVAFLSVVHYPADGLLKYTDFPVYIEGTVIDEPQFHDDYTAYRLKVDIVETKEARYVVPGTLLVKIYGNEDESYWFGERLRLRGAILEPRGQRNPGGFDYRLYLRSQGIDALVYPKAALVSSLGQGDLNMFTVSALKLRSAMVGVIDKTLPSPSAELMTAILFGQRHSLPEEIEHNFRRAGVGHLMAVSGLHVGLAAAMILGLWRKLKLRGRLPLVLAIVLVFAYAYLTGMRPSALRAAIMVSAALAALLLDREQDLPTTVAFAALVTLFINPLLLFSVGFQLSYAATLALIYTYRPLEHLLKTMRFPAILRSPLAVTLAAQIGVLPLCLYYFHYLPAAAVLFNLLLLPLIGFVIGLGLTGALIGLIFPFFGDLLLWASRPLLEFMLLITGLSSMPGFYLAVYPPGDLFMIIYYGFLSAVLFVYYQSTGQAAGKDRFLLSSDIIGFLKNLLLKRHHHLRFAAVTVLLLAVLFIWSGVLFPVQKKLTVTFIDVGQGAAAMIETPCGKVILVDAGGEPAYRGDPGEIGETVLLPLMRRQGVRRVELAVISHPHEDHFGGFGPLVEEIAIKRLLISPAPGESVYYDQLLEQAELKGLAISTARTGQIWSCGDDLFLEVIAPSEQLFKGTKSDLNNNSIVFMLHYREVRFLFTGDIEDPAVEKLLRQQADLKANLLLIPHHGGYLAAMPVFLEAVQPSLAVIQVGRNSFGHPHVSVISSLEQAGVEIYRTDHHGAVIVETDGVEFEVATTGQPVLVFR